MQTIHNENGNTVERVRNRRPGEAYVAHADGAESAYLDMTLFSDDALLAILLDRAKIANDKKNNKPQRERVTMLKALKSGDDERGKTKRGPGRPKKND